ncbi:uncharacterized protein LOC143037015 [Oratosquilla oratoria]|uniref:uncharacterized protein LOC143037015 n=1 Tax=Oratosquilla oratoria TaxID=337810 RepID=UPI003F759652
MEQSTSAKPFEWTKSITLYFIELLKQHPAIWNIKCKEHKMRNIKSASIETLKADLYSFTKCNVRNEDITRKLHTLKTQFHREMTAIKASKKSGAGTEGIYTPKLWCFNNLLFLAEGEIVRASTSSLDVETTENLQQGGDHVRASTYSSLDVETTENLQHLGDQHASTFYNLDGGGNTQIVELATLPRNEETSDYSFTPSPAPSLTSASSVNPSPSSSHFARSSSGTATKRKAVDQTDKVLEIALSKLSSLPGHGDVDPYLDSVAKLVYNGLNNMSEDQRRLANKLIFDAISMGNMGDLTREHQILRVEGSDKFMV